MEISQIIPHVEVLIFASEKPLTNAELLEMVNNALGFIEDQAVPDQVAAAIEAIREKYASEFYPFEVRESGGGWQFLTKKDYHKTVALINGDKFLKRLSAAALETLAIIAYKQPITKGDIESIRGVNSDYSVQKLLEKELIIIAGRNEDLPGKPLVYATSKSFMDYFGLNSAGELPSIKEVLMDLAVEPYVVTHDNPVESDRQEEPQLFNGHVYEGAVEEEPTAEPLEAGSADEPHEDEAGPASASHDEEIADEPGVTDESPDNEPGPADDSAPGDESHHSDELPDEES